MPGSLKNEHLDLDDFLELLWQPIIAQPTMFTQQTLDKQISLNKHRTAINAT